LALVVAAATAACGEATTTPDTTTPDTTAPDTAGRPPVGSEQAVSLVQVERAGPAVDADPAPAVRAIDALGYPLLARIAELEAPGTNVVVSPTSVAIALALMEPGTVGDATDQLHRLLAIDDPDAFHAAMAALEAHLVSLSVTDDDGGELAVRVANAAWLQQGYPFEASYLEAIGTHYGPVLYAVDYQRDPEAVAAEINRFVAEVTRDRIQDLIGPGVLDVDTVLTLVNALYLKASWLEPFAPEATAEGTFTLADGSQVTVPLMHGSSDSATRGDGWVAATKGYVGGLAIQFVLPDEGRFDEVAGRLAEVVAEHEARRGDPGPLVLPRFETRFAVELTPALQALGLTAPYAEGHLLGIADDRRLVLDAAVHETFLAVDEEGTEAAAATALVMRVTSAPMDPVPVVLDRPFLLRIADPSTGATLFLGIIGDPTAGA
jgi:serpin B